MHKLLLLAFVFSGLSFTACNQENIDPTIPVCIQDMLTTIDQDNPLGNKLMVGEVEQKKLLAIYHYRNNATSYFELVFNTRDGFTELYDKNCEYICSPNGGFWGGGAGDCPEWLDIEDRELLWETE